MTTALFAWIDIVMGDADAMAACRLKTIGLASGTAKALRAGLEVMKSHLGLEPTVVLRSDWDHCGAVRC